MSWDTENIFTCMTWQANKQTHTLWRWCQLVEYITQVTGQRVCSTSLTWLPFTTTIDSLYAIVVKWQFRRKDASNEDHHNSFSAHKTETCSLCFQYKLLNYAPNEALLLPRARVSWSRTEARATVQLLKSVSAAHNVFPRMFPEWWVALLLAKQTALVWKNNCFNHWKLGQICYLKCYVT